MNSDATDELTQIKQKLNQLDQKIQRVSRGAADKYKKVNDLLFAYKPGG